jgi:hypothetical protein
MVDRNLTRMETKTKFHNSKMKLHQTNLHPRKTMTVLKPLTRIATEILKKTI